MKDLGLLCELFGQTSSGFNARPGPHNSQPFRAERALAGV